LRLAVRQRRCRAAKIPIARFLNENRRGIDRLHEQVGLVLQAESEAAEGAEASMKPKDLRNLARQQLLDRGFAADAADDISQQLLDAATKRLVLPTGCGSWLRDS
jgi:hypothetical protein